MSRRSLLTSEGTLTSDSSDINEEFAKLVFKRYLRDYQWLIELARLYSFPAIVLDEIRIIVEKSPHIRGEKERFSFDLILDKPGLSLRPAHVKVDLFHVSKTSRLADLKNAVDGINSCYLVSKTGMLSIVEVPKEWRRQTASATMMEVSAKTSTLAFHVDIDLTRVYSNGENVRTWRKGVWLVSPCVDFYELVNDGYPQALLSGTMAFCVRMSELGKPATIVLQKSDALESCQAFREIHFNECDLASVGAEQLIGYAEMDGAVVVNTKARVLGIAQRLIYREIGSGFGGARHTSASRYSAEHECVVFVVSADGPISIFKGGTTWRRLFSELKP